MKIIEITIIKLTQSMLITALVFNVKVLYLQSMLYIGILKSVKKTIKKKGLK